MIKTIFKWKIAKNLYHKYFGNEEEQVEKVEETEKTEGKPFYKKWWFLGLVTYFIISRLTDDE